MQSSLVGNSVAELKCGSGPMGSQLMKLISRIIALGLFAAGMIAMLPVSGAASADELPAAARYYPFVGHWKGRGEIAETGKIPIRLTLKLVCKKAVLGWALYCDMTAKSGKLVMSEADLMGVDAVTGKGHWFAFTNQGESYDYITDWISADEMTANYSWVQKGERMQERITVVGLFRPCPVCPKVYLRPAL
jgi:hypothetical protein